MAHAVQGKSPAPGLVTTIAGPSQGKAAGGAEGALQRICVKKKRLQKEAKAQLVTAGQLGNRASTQELQKERKRRVTGSRAAPGRKTGATPSKEKAGRQRGSVASDISPEAKVVRKPTKRGDKFDKFWAAREPEAGDRQPEIVTGPGPSDRDRRSPPQPEALTGSGSSNRDRRSPPQPEALTGSGSSDRDRRSPQVALLIHHGNKTGDRRPDGTGLASPTRKEGGPEETVTSFMDTSEAPTHS